MAAKPETKDIKAEEQKPKVPYPMGWGLGRPLGRETPAHCGEGTFGFCSSALMSLVSGFAVAANLLAALRVRP